MKLRPIGHEDRLSIIDHLDELRTRIIVCGGALLVVFCVCFWQNHALLSVLNRPLPPTAKTALGVQQDNAAKQGHIHSDEQKQYEALAASGSTPPSERSHYSALASDEGQLAKLAPGGAAQPRPLAIGVGEAFMTTVLVSAYFALMITLPLVLYQLYAFVLPALSGEERRVAVPAAIAAPVLFLMGAVFTYFFVLPPAIHFLQGYNADQFLNLVQAKSLYRFEIILMMGIGLAFQVPLLAVGLQKVGIISSRTLTLNWRYATVLIAVIVAALPGVDPVTMTMEMLPLVGLYVASILLLKWVEYRNHRRARADAKHEAARAAASSVVESADDRDPSSD